MVYDVILVRGKCVLKEEGKYVITIIVVVISGLWGFNSSTFITGSWISEIFLLHYSQDYKWENKSDECSTHPVVREWPSREEWAKETSPLVSSSSVSTDRVLLKPHPLTHRLTFSNGKFFIKASVSPIHTARELLLSVLTGSTAAWPSE